MPEINLLFFFLYAAKDCSPTFLVAVLNPKDYPNCSTQNKFGLTVTVSHALFVTDHFIHFFFTELS